MTPASVPRPPTKKALEKQAAAQRAKARKSAAKKALLKKLMAQPPTLREERKLLREGHRFVAGIDEVGRGSLAGPVSVGVVVVDLETKSAPTGVRDSKLLAPAAREKLVPRLLRWAPMSAVGHADSDEIDEIGIIAALRLAAARAFAQLEVQPDCALLDGSHNWLSVPADPVEEVPQGTALFDFDAAPVPVGHPLSFIDGRPLASIVPSRVITQVKADLRCAAVAAASVLAKVERDGLMVDFATEYPGYGWELNKGYSAPDHLAALRRLGPTRMHRLSWNIPGSDGIYGETFDLDGLEAVDDAADAFAGVPEGLAEEVAEELASDALSDDELADVELSDAELSDAGLSSGSGGGGRLRAEPAPPQHGRAVGYDHEELTLFS